MLPLQLACCGSWEVRVVQCEGLVTPHPLPYSLHGNNQASHASSLGRVLFGPLLLLQGRGH